MNFFEGFAGSMLSVLIMLVIYYITFKRKSNEKKDTEKIWQNDIANKMQTLLKLIDEVTGIKEHCIYRKQEINERLQELTYEDKLAKKDIETITKDLGTLKTGMDKMNSSIDKLLLMNAEQLTQLRSKNKSQDEKINVIFKKIEDLK